MTKGQMLDRISSDSLREATGRGWDEWLETLDAAGFEVGVRRSVDASEADVWELLTSRPELWLGEGVAPGDRLRLTWQPQGWASPATLQFALSRSQSGKTTISAHLEKLPDATARDTTREHLREALDRIVAAGS